MSINCPKCKTLLKCGCPTCRERWKKAPGEFTIVVHPDIEECPKCGLRKTLSWWLSYEWDLYKSREKKGIGGGKWKPKEN